MLRPFTTACTALKAPSLVGAHAVSCSSLVWGSGLRLGVHTSSLRGALFGGKKQAEPLASRPDLGASPVFDLPVKENVIPTKGKATDITESGTPLLSSVASELTKASTKEYQFSTANYKTGYKKLRFLAKQISRKPAQEAIDQMEFSAKRWAKPLLHTLALARKNATLQKEMDPERLVVHRTWVGKGQYQKKIDYKGRGRFGMKKMYSSHIKFVLREAEPERDQANRGFRRNIKRFNITKKVWTPMKEAKPIYNPSPYYNW
ncbi:39S ribosomal protein L22, mitochondrial [Dispira simplex]|nr:39S ribosomal protein L22, mitochondrial [Dispira simplex]